jgi:transposase-like protein
LRKVNMVCSGLWHVVNFRPPGGFASPPDLMASFEFFERPMATARDVLTPDALSMLQAIARAGSFAAAARAIGVVPSALTYRVRQIEEALDVLLFDRSTRQARLTPAGDELLSAKAAMCWRPSTPWPTASSG